MLAIALQESIADVAATVKFLVFRPFRRGGPIETMGHLDYVHELLVFTTILLDRDQRMVTLSDSKIHEDGVVNYTRTGSIRAGFS